jgi:integrase
MPKLTKRVVEGAAPAAGDLFVWDDELPGFGVRVYPSGTRKYLLQWKRDGRTRRLVLGAHGPLTCEQARAAALAALGRVARGEDPAEERDLSRRDPTVAALAELWLAEGCAGKKASTLAMDRSRLGAHVLPLLGRVRVRALTRADVERFARDVAAGRTAREEAGGKRGPRIVRGGEGVATRTLGMLGAMLEFAAARGMRPDNPVKGVRRVQHRERERVLSEAETARLGEALAAAEAEGEPWQAVGLVRLLLLTGLRRDEARTLRWEHVDLGGGRLLLPDTKTGRSARPLAAAGVGLLADLRGALGQLSRGCSRPPAGQGTSWACRRRGRASGAGRAGGRAAARPAAQPRQRGRGLGREPVRDRQGAGPPQGPQHGALRPPRRRPGQGRGR